MVYIGDVIGVNIRFARPGSAVMSPFALLSDKSVSIPAAPDGAAALLRLGSGSWAPVLHLPEMMPGLTGVARAAMAGCHRPARRRAGREARRIGCRNATNRCEFLCRRGRVSPAGRTAPRQDTVLRLRDRAARRAWRHRDL